jgi:hypothetical protein
MKDLNTNLGVGESQTSGGVVLLVEMICEVEK